jgi:hypothetical protein
MTIAILIVVALVIVVVGALLLYKFANKAQTMVPDAVDPPAADRVVGTDDQGNAITEAQDPASAPRDQAGFESLLQDEIHDRGMRQPRADDEV